ncbi:methyl farnesoate epoxidase-like [Oratosquilla oratoria]|uniref:methyl farnesoate epoxidase-like n=1 Tax=Oratosquilla oratoria TaxID=337810 RepID=UPI003F75B2A3
MLLATVLVLLLVVLFLKQFKKPKNFPPGPFRIPFVGFGPFMKPHLSHKQMWKVSKEYDSSVVGVFLGSQPTVFVHTWETVKEVLANDDFNARPYFVFTVWPKHGRRTGVKFVSGNLWRNQRRFSLHHFRNLGFGKRTHESVMHEEAEELIQELSTIKGPFSIQGPVGVSTVNILWSVIGGERFPRSDPRLMDLVTKLYNLFRSGNPSGGVLGAFPAVRFIAPKWSGYELLITGFLVFHCLKESIEAHKKTFTPDKPRDFIDIYLQEIESTKNPEFTEEQLVGICTDVFSAGTETTASFVTFAIMFMCLYPEVQQKVQKELGEVVGWSRYPSMGDKTNLPYTEATYTEIMRIRCPAIFTVPHYAERDTVLKGYHVPKDTLVMVNLYSVLMDPDHFEEPENFRPERFLDENGKFQRDERIIPFGKGKRICLGESLARTNTFILFTSLVQRLTFSLPPGEHLTNTEGVAGFTLGPPIFQVVATPRRSS